MNDKNTFWRLNDTRVWMRCDAIITSFAPLLEDMRALLGCG